MDNACFGIFDFIAPLSEVRPQQPFTLSKMIEGRQLLDLNEKQEEVDFGVATQLLYVTSNATERGVSPDVMEELHGLL